MKRLFKIVLRILMITVIIGIIFFGIRWINSSRYSEYIAPDEESVYVNPSNLTLYETNQDNMTVETIEERYVNGFHLVPDDIQGDGIIITFGGSDGSSNYDLAVQIAQEGYEVYSLFFFGIGDLPEAIHEVPIEFFGDVLTYHDNHSQTQGPITVLGASKGAELTLNLATVYDEIDNIILYAPSAYNFFSLNQLNTDDSSWSHEEEPLPYLSNMEGSSLENFKMIAGFMFYTPVSYTPIYQSIIEGTDDESLEAARIKAEDFDGDGIVFAGGDDLMWDSESMGELINEQASQIEIYVYPEAGHLFSMGRYLGNSSSLIAMGGNQEVNQVALEESNDILKETLANWHNKE